MNQQWPTAPVSKDTRDCFGHVCHEVNSALAMLKNGVPVSWHTLEKKLAVATSDEERLAAYKQFAHSVTKLNFASIEQLKSLSNWSADIYLNREPK